MVQQIILLLFHKTGMQDKKHYSATNAMGTGPFKITLREPNTKTVF